MNITVDWLQWSALIGIVIAVGGPAAGLWLRIEARFRENENNLAAYKLEAQRDFATKSEANTGSDRIMAAIGDLKEMVVRTGERIDRLIDNRQSRSARP